MNNIIITTDSGLDPMLTDTMIKGQIIKNNNESFKDGDLSNKEILNQTRNGNTFKTASPILNDYYDMFTKYLDEKLDIVHLSMSSGISEGSVNSALIAANDLNEEYENKVYVIDTLTGATGGTIISEYANKLVEKGYSINEVIDKLNDLKKRIKTSFYVPNPEGFIRSGRDKSSMCTKDKALLIGAKISKMAGIKYRVDFNSEGNLYVKNIFRGKVYDSGIKMVKEIISSKTINDYEKCIAVIGSVHEDILSMNEIKDYLLSFDYFDKVIDKDINGVVACYGSSDLYGISLIKKL